jgi:electron transfer flavoprotein alpha subunit
VAELLGIPHVSGVVSLEADPPRAKAVREVEDAVERVEVDLPAVFTVTDRTNKPRTPGRAAGNCRVVGAAEISDRLDIFGEAGSPTCVADPVEERMERIERENRVVVDARKSPEEGAYAMLDLIKKALGEGGPSAERLNPPSGAAGGSEMSVVTEEGLSGGVTKASCEMLTKASELAAKVGGYVTAIYGGEKPEELVASGADREGLLQEADPRDYMAHADALMRLVTERRPWAVLAPSTSYGRDVLARAAARLGLAADCVNLDVVGYRSAQFKPAFGGAVVSVIYSKTTPYMATARPGTSPPPPPPHT